MPQQFEFHLNVRELNDPNSAQDNLLPLGFTAIGRLPENEIVLRDSGISKKHAHIHCTEDGCEITDLQSTNGTRTNGEKPPMTPVVLKHGDRVGISDFELLFEMYAIQSSGTPLESKAVLPPQPEPLADKPESEAKSSATPPQPPAVSPPPPSLPLQSSDHFDS